MNDESRTALDGSIMRPSMTSGSPDARTPAGAEGSARPGQITELLIAHAAGDRTAFDRLVPLVYADLRRVARRVLGPSPSAATVNTTVLVHEAYVRLVDEHRIAWQNRSHFFAIAARAMRRILVDHARHRFAQKRGRRREHIALDENAAAAESQAELVMALNEALEKMTAFNPRLVHVVECRLFAGLTDEETARALGSPLRSVQRDWQRARAWLMKDLPR